MMLSATDLHDLLIALDLRIIRYQAAADAETYAPAHAADLRNLRDRLEAVTPEVGAGLAARLELVAAPRVGAKWGRKTDVLTVGEGEEWQERLNKCERRETAPNPTPIHTQGE